MPSPTYTPLANITLTSTASNVTFNNIPSTYKDLLLVALVRTIGSETDVQFNNDSGNNYTTTTVRGGADGNYYSAQYTANGIKPQNSVGPDETGLRDYFKVHIMDYSATNKHKVSLLLSGNANKSHFQAHGVRWANNNAITSVKCNAPFGNYQAGCTFALYGVTA